MDTKQILEKLKNLSWRSVAVISVCIVFLGIAVGLYFRRIGKADQSDVFSISDNGTVDQKENNNSDEVSADPCEIYVDVSGAVNKSGVYCLNSGDIVEKAIESAGGLAEMACKWWVEQKLNRAEPVQSGSKIYIPFEGDTICLGTLTEVVDLQDEAGPDMSGLCADGKISINSASLEQLDSIVGVGPSTAQKIVDGRPYSALEDLMNVKGIGDATFEKMKDQLCL